jgi:hypothetical protein
LNVPRIDYIINDTTGILRVSFDDGTTGTDTQVDIAGGEKFAGCVFPVDTLYYVNTVAGDFRLFSTLERD